MNVNILIRIASTIIFLTFSLLFAR